MLSVKFHKKWYIKIAKGPYLNNSFIHIEYVLFIKLLLAAFQTFKMKTELKVCLSLHIFCVCVFL